MFNLKLLEWDVGWAHQRPDVKHKFTSSLILLVPGACAELISMSWALAIGGVSRGDFFSFPLLLREGCHSMWVLRGLPCGIGWIGAGCHRGVMCTFLLTLQGQPYVGAGGGSFQLPPLSTLLSKQEQAIQTHTPNGRLAGRVLLRATSCVCVCVIRCLQF